MESVRILGTGSYVPPKVLSNDDLQKMGLDTSDEWIVQRTGVRERRIADPDVNTSDLGREASLRVKAPRSVESCCGHEKKHAGDWRWKGHGGQERETGQERRDELE